MRRLFPTLYTQQSLLALSRASAITSDTADAVRRNELMQSPNRSVSKALGNLMMPEHGDLRVHLLDRTKSGLLDAELLDPSMNLQTFSVLSSLCRIGFLQRTGDLWTRTEFSNEFDPVLSRSATADDCMAAWNGSVHVQWLQTVEEAWSKLDDRNVRRHFEHFLMWTCGWNYKEMLALRVSSERNDAVEALAIGATIGAVKCFGQQWKPTVDGLRLSLDPKSRLHAKNRM